MPQPRVETYAYDANRRYTVNKGTRCVFVEMNVPFMSPKTILNPTIRRITVNQATELAEKAWIEAFGIENFQYDKVQILVTHVTVQVCVEFRMVD